MNETDATLAFHSLGPNEILNAVESQGFSCNGQLIALNSYENRVYRLGQEQGPPLVAKFYRPQRWSDETLLEEHEFALELAAEEIPVIAPLKNPDGHTLLEYEQFRFSLYPMQAGHAPELDNPDHLEQLGRFIGRLHAVGELKPFNHRPELTLADFGQASYDYLLSGDFIPSELIPAYSTLGKDLLAKLAQKFAETAAPQILRLHGDCHAGNLLCRDDRFYIVDLDDARSGPAIQDLWMFLSGDRHYMQARLADVLEGYSQFRDFNPAELPLIEALRSLRIMHHAAWLARRWQDPAFQQAFSWFNSPRYWEDHVLALREQFALLDEEPLRWH